MLTSRWWPFAGLEKLLDLAHFVTCIFTVDGMIDQVSGTGKHNVEAFQALYRMTESFVEPRYDESSRLEILDASNPVIDSFRVLKKLLCKHYTNGE